LVNDVIEKTVKKFNDDNGNRKFDTKDLVIFFNKQHEKALVELKSEIKEANKLHQKRYEWGLKYTAEHDRIIQHITDDLAHIAEELPNKGFCGKTQNIINCWQPDKKEPPLNRKVDTLWYDRKLLKFIAGAVVIAVITSVGTLIVTIVL